jgi:hypothetical protein
METIQEIGKKILKRTDNEFHTGKTNKAVAYSHVRYNGEEQYYWLLQGEMNQAFVRGVNIFGDTTPDAPATEVALNYLKEGKVISKNAPLARHINEKLGVHTIKLPNGQEAEIEIYSFSKYVPIITNDETDAKQGAIFIPEGETRFDSLRKLIKEIEELVAERDDLLRDKEEKSEEEKEAIKVQVSGLEQEISKKKEGVRRYINQNVELRYLPILNAEQNEVKLYPLKRTLIINGGPGTGKTTTLIQRIKYLTSSDILDNEPDLTLTDEDKSLLFDQNKSWIFFSPTELLKNYLKEAMVKEGLIATDKTAFDWNQFLKKMIREYLLVNTETKRPFIFHKSDKSYFKNDRTATSTLLTAFDTVYFNYNIEKLEKINKIDIKGQQYKCMGIKKQLLLIYSKRPTILLEA